MAKRVAFKLREAEIPYIQDVANQMGISLEILARKALFYVVNEAYRNAQEILAERVRQEQEQAGAAGAAGVQQAEQAEQIAQTGGL